MCTKLTYAIWYSANGAQKSTVMLIEKQSHVKNSNIAVTISGDILQQVPWDYCWQYIAMG